MNTYKLRDEYLGLGDSPNKPIPDYLLYVIVGASLTQFLSKICIPYVTQAVFHAFSLMNNT